MTKTETQHTPEPQKLTVKSKRRCHINLDMIPVENWPMSPDVEQLRAFIVDGGEKFALLIAAAPYLLSAARGALSVLEETDQHEEFPYIMGKLRAAIAKAEGSK